MRYIIYDAKHRQVVCDTEDYGCAVSDVARYLTFHEDASWTHLYPVEVLGPYDKDNSKLWAPIYRAHELHEVVDSLLNGKLYSINGEKL